ncbi:DOMON-like domain-containing protein [Cyanobacteria bacterium FACHB-63]|nr:DOMON-like domain-containing protein [Cyanobacteria bacterium FACHB-63]
MSAQNFTLYPFGTAFDSAILSLSGNIALSDHRLILQYDLIDNQSQVLIPDKTLPNRKHNLWETTCFEFFIGAQNDRAYWEFNLSPSGDWNVYRFDDYRAGMQEETAFSALPFEVETRSHHTTLTIELDLEVIKLTQPLEISVTAVIEQLNHNITYWAIEHCGTEADFHIRDSFALRL